MTVSLANATFALPLRAAHNFRESSILEQDPHIADGTLDGSVGQLTRFLRELIAMTGQDETDVPVLELQFGDILTKTTVQTAERHYLVITAYMPQSRPHYTSQATAMTSLQDTEEDIHYLWHADEGRYVGIRRIPVTNFPDEPSVMDAIMTTSDQASAWFSANRSSKPRV